MKRLTIICAALIVTSIVTAIGVAVSASHGHDAVVLALISVASGASGSVLAFWVGIKAADTISASLRRLLRSIFRKVR